MNTSGLPDIYVATYTQSPNAAGLRAEDVRMYIATYVYIRQTMSDYVYYI